MADVLGKKISELAETTDLAGLYTIGSDRNNQSKKVPLQFVKEAADYANAQGDYAKGVGDTIQGNTGVNEYPAFSSSAQYAAGSVVRYNNKLYRFTALHPAGAWVGTDAIETSIKAETDVKLTELESFKSSNLSDLDIVKNIVAAIYVVDSKVRNYTWRTQYFAINHPNFGGSDYFLIQLQAVENGKVIGSYNYYYSIANVVANEVILMKERGDSSHLEGVSLFVRFAENYSKTTSQILVTSLIYVNAYNSTHTPLIADLIGNGKSIGKKYEVIPYYPGQALGEEKIYGEYGVAINNYTKVSKIPLFRGDFDLMENTDVAVANNIRKTIKSIKLVNGFDRSVKYFISAIKWKAGGETDKFYILLRSLPSGAYEYEWRISASAIQKGVPIYITDEARGRTILLTLADTADDAININVTYYQDSLLNKDAFMQSDNNEIRYHYVSVQNSNDYAIRNVVHSLKGKASYYDRYVVKVPNGNYFEMDIQMPDFVTLRGQSEKGVVIALDGTSSKTAPSDLSLGTGGVPINTLNTSDRHIIWLCANATVENLTLQVKSCKYAIHQDSDKQAYESHVKNVTFVDLGGNVKMVGIGAWANQHLFFENCYFKTTTSVRQAVVFHNWDNQKAPCSLTFVGCKTDHDLVWCQELGSGNQDVVRVINCTTASPYEGNIQYSKASGYNNAPVCVKIVIEGKSMQYYSSVADAYIMDLTKVA